MPRHSARPRPPLARRPQRHPAKAANLTGSLGTMHGRRVPIAPQRLALACNYAARLCCSGGNRPTECCAAWGTAVGDGCTAAAKLGTGARHPPPHPTLSPLEKAARSIDDGGCGCQPCQPLAAVRGSARRRRARDAGIGSKQDSAAHPPGPYHSRCPSAWRQAPQDTAPPGGLLNIQSESPIK